MYEIKYKCRLCGKTYSTGATGTEKTAADVVVNVALEEQRIRTRNPIPNQPGIIEPHHCADGSFGVADFLGMKYEEKK